VDLVSTNQGTLTLFFQNAPGVFTPGANALVIGVGSFSVAAAADLDGDGDVDLVSGTNLSNTLTLFFQSAPGVFTPGANALGTVGRPICVAAADLDGDGGVDLVYANDSNTLRLFFGGL
jgi:hypothetical protein